MYEAEKAIGYTFKDKNLLLRALTLPSYDGKNNNQVLEFFGDAILEFIVSESIFDMGGNEGSLTERRKALVSDVALTPVSEKLGLDRLLLRKNDSANKKAIPSVYEAVIAGIYLDGGMDEAKKFVLKTLDFSKRPENNYKGMLQEKLQGEGLPCPAYIHSDTGTPQKHNFVVKIIVKDKEFTASAQKKQDAEQSVAKEAYEYFYDKVE